MFEILHTVEEVQLSWYSIRHSTDVLSSTAELIETNSIHFKFWNSFKNFVCVLSVTLLVVVPVFWCQMCAGLELCSASHLINFVQRVKLKSRYVQTILWISWENMFHAGCGASSPDVLQWNCYDISPAQDTKPFARQLVKVNHWASKDQREYCHKENHN